MNKNVKKKKKKEENQSDGPKMWELEDIKSGASGNFQQNFKGLPLMKAPRSLKMVLKIA